MRLPGPVDTRFCQETCVSSVDPAEQGTPVPAKGCTKVRLLPREMLPKAGSRYRQSIHEVCTAFQTPERLAIEWRERKKLRFYLKIELPAFFAGSVSRRFCGGSWLRISMLRVMSKHRIEFRLKTAQFPHWVGSGTQDILQASDCFRAVSGTRSGVNLAGDKFFCPVQRAGVSEIGQTLFA